MIGYRLAWVPGFSQGPVSTAHVLLVPLSVKYSVAAKRLRWQRRQHPNAVHKAMMVWRMAADPNMMMLDWSRRRKQEEPKHDA